MESCIEMKLAGGGSTFGCLPSDYYHYDCYDCSEEDESTEDGNRDDSVEAILCARQVCVRSHWRTETGQHVLAAARQQVVDTRQGASGVALNDCGWLLLLGVNADRVASGQRTNRVIGHLTCCLAAVVEFVACSRCLRSDVRLLAIGSCRADRSGERRKLRLRACGSRGAIVGPELGRLRWLLSTAACGHRRWLRLLCWLRLWWNRRQQRYLWHRQRRQRKLAKHLASLLQDR